MAGKTGIKVVQVAASVGGQPAASDYIQLVADQIRPYLGSKRYVTLGTDGFGRSDRRRELRHFFEVDGPSIAYATVKALVDAGTLKQDALAKALQLYQINPDKPNPVTV